MSQTLAIFHQACRGLKARKMFWIVLVISLLVVAEKAGDPPAGRSKAGRANPLF